MFLPFFGESLLMSGVLHLENSMRNILKIALISAGLLNLGQFALADEAPNDAPKFTCFKVHKLRNFTYIDNYHVMFESRFPNHNYLATFARKCSAAKFAMKMHPTFENQMVCTKDLQYVNMQEDHCPVTTIQEVKNLDEAKGIAAGENTARQKARRDNK